jgi:hypothetical protein
MSVSCHIQTHAPQQMGSILFDHIVGMGEDIWRDFEAECLRGLKIDDELEAGGLFNW